MPVSSSFLPFVLDQLDGLGDVTPRRMFGAVGLYCGDLFFAILDDDVLYLKVGDANRRRHEEAGMEPFKPYPDTGSAAEAAVTKRNRSSRFSVDIRPRAACGGAPCGDIDAISSSTPGRPRAAVIRPTRGAGEVTRNT